MSVIETPPEDRHAGPDLRPGVPSESWCGEAISREIQPGRPGLLPAQPGARASIAAAAAARRWCPRRCFAVAHGQMDEDELEQVMMDFLRRPVRRAGLHHHHRERPRHPQRQHPDRRAAPTASAWPSSTSSAAGSGGRTGWPTVTSPFRRI